MPKKKPKEVERNGVGRPARFTDAKKMEIGRAKGTAQQAAAKYGCSVAFVYMCRKEARIRAEGAEG